MRTALMVAAVPELDTQERYVAALADVTYKNFQFVVELDVTRWYMQVQFDNTDAATGEYRLSKGRKWYLSEHMTKSEIVQTALAAVLAMEEHEAREEFLYKGQPVFGPHYQVDALWQLCVNQATDER